MTAEDLISAVNVLDVRNNALFLPGKLLVPPDLARPPMALWNGQQLGVLPYTRCNGYAGVLLAMLGFPIPWKTANELAAWFPASPLWREVNLTEGVAIANAGPGPLVIVATEQPHGHIAVGVANLANPGALYCTAAGAFNTPCQRFVDQFGQLAQVAHFYTPKGQS